jgi:hypothetical protein
VGPVTRPLVELRGEASGAALGGERRVAAAARSEGASESMQGEKGAGEMVEVLEAIARM